MNYTAEGLELLEAIENGEAEQVAFDNDQLKQMARQTLESLHAKKQITINIKQSDLEFIKQRARDIGISYQSIIQALTRNYATGKLELKL